MHKVLESICSELDQLVAQVNTSISNDEPMSVAHNNWSFPGVSGADLVEAASSIADTIKELGQDTLGSNEQRIADYVRRLQFLRTNTVANIWGNAATGVPAYLLTLESLRKVLAPALTADPRIETAATLRRVTTQVRAMESRLRELEPRSTNLSNMVDRIERAHDAADQLPTDLESLKESREKVERLLREAEKDRGHISSVREDADGLDKRLKQSAEEASAVVARCESAYAMATSQGLAAAFAERSKALDWSMWAWVVGLILALALGGIFGSKQLHDLSDLMKAPATSGGAIALNLLLSLLSIAAPVWFSWLATKQVGQRFRLSEDYAFKASVSRAYEGYRREAARIDKDMEASLLASALRRMDEQPLRLIESASHGSPWHELASSALVKDAVRSVPGFAGSVLQMAKDALAKVAPGTTAAEKPKQSPSSPTA